MKYASCLLCLVLLTAPALAVDVHLYFLGGQSNGNGRANAADIPVGSPLASPQPDVALWYRNTQEGATNNTLPESQIVDLAPGAGYGGSDPIYPKEFGPEVAFGRTLANALPGQNIMIIKHTYGGTNLHTQWSNTGSVYAEFLVTVNAAIDHVIANGDTPIPMGMIWVQGESDAGNATNAANYGANLADLIGRVRNDLFDGALAPFVFNQLSNNQYNSLNANHIALRNGQLNVSQTVANTAMAVTDDDALFTTIPSAIIHFDANGQINLGTALANEMIALLTSPVLTIDRDTGNITLSNGTSADITVAAYLVTSADGGLAPEQWSRVSDSDTWSVLSESSTELGESEAGGGDGGALLAANVGALELGGIWRRTPYEDVAVTLTLADQSVIAPIVRYTSSPIRFGDFTGDGEVSLADYQVLLDNLYADVSGLTMVDAYQRGDINGDLAINQLDYLGFRDAYDTLHGAGSLASAVSLVPEPRSVVVLAVAAIIVSPWPRRRKPAPTTRILSS